MTDHPEPTNEQIAQWLEERAESLAALKHQPLNGAQLNALAATRLRAAPTPHAPGFVVEGHGIRFSTPEPWREALEAIAKTRVSPACARIAKAALAAAPAAPSVGVEGELVEAVARIIDAGAWVDATYAPGRMVEARALALAKARAILRGRNGGDVAHARNVMLAALGRPTDQASERAALAALSARREG